MVPFFHAPIQERMLNMANKKSTSIKLSSSIKHIAIENENGEVVTELLVDYSDESTMSRLMDLVDRLEEIGNETQKKIDEAGFIEDEKITKENAKEVLKINTEAINSLIEETELMFGKGLIHNIFKDNYELNPKFVPDIDVLTDFYNQIIPIIEGIFKDKQKKYSTVKGK